MGIDDMRENSSSPFKCKAKSAEGSPTKDEKSDERKLLPHPGILRRQLPIIWLLRRSDRRPSLELMPMGVAPAPSNGSSLWMLWRKLE